MREQTKRMLDQKLRDEAARQLKDAADSIKRGNWGIAYMELCEGLGYLNDLDSYGEFFDSVIHVAKGGERDMESDWSSYMEGGDR